VLLSQRVVGVILKMVHKILISQSGAKKIESGSTDGMGDDEALQPDDFALLYSGSVLIVENWLQRFY